MKIIQVTLLSVLAVVTLLAPASASCPNYVFKVIEGTADDARGLAPVVDKYRKFLGGEDNGNDPPTGGKGQRSINWDADIVPFDMPFDFFNTKVPRGAIFTALNEKFAVSNPPHPPPKDDRFSSIVGKFLSKMFVRFSLERLFTPVDDNAFLTTFEIPGARYKRALTRGFGAVFTDVDRFGKTKIAFYDEFGCFIAVIDVPARSKGLSFVGIVVFDKYYNQLSVISKVGIQLGEVPVSHIVEGKDVVVVDDLIYGEPIGKKEPDFHGDFDKKDDGRDFDKKDDFHGDFDKKDDSDGDFDKKDDFHGDFDKKDDFHGDFDKKDDGRDFDKKDDGRDFDKKDDGRDFDKKHGFDKKDDGRDFDKKDDGRDFDKKHGFDKKDDGHDFDKKDDGRDFDKKDDGHDFDKKEEKKGY